MYRKEELSVNDNILIISPVFAPATVVGAARMTSLAGYLVREGYSVTVLSAGKHFCKNDLWTRTIPEGVKLIELKEGGDYIHVLREKTEQLLGSKDFSVCISSMGPFQTQKFLWKVCKKNNIPLILDYRDPWLFYPYYYAGKSMIANMKRLLFEIYSFPYEKASIRYASKTVTVTDKHADIFKKRYKHYADKVCTIYNGHEDLSPFSQNEREKGKRLYSIGCAGKFLYYSKSMATEVIHALEELNRENICCQLLHIGEESDNAFFLVKDSGYQIPDTRKRIYEYCGKKEYKDAMKFLTECDACLIIGAAQEGLGTKVFDYIGLNKPIIYCGVLPSELGEFVSRFNNVVVADNLKDIKEGIKRLVQNQVYKLEDNPTDFYSREKQNERYERLIREVVKANH